MKLYDSPFSQPSNVQLCANHVATLRIRAGVSYLTQVLGGSEDFLLRKAHFGDPFQSQHKSQTSARGISELYSITEACMSKQMTTGKSLIHIQS